MRKLQNTLYITTQGSYLHKERETLVVEQECKKAAQLPVHSIGHIFCFGNVLVSPFLLGFCGENNVNLAFFTENGRLLGGEVFSLWVCFFRYVWRDRQKFYTCSSYNPII